MIGDHVIASHDRIAGDVVFITANAGPADSTAKAVAAVILANLFILIILCLVGFDVSSPLVPIPDSSRMQTE